MSSGFEVERRAILTPEQRGEVLSIMGGIGKIQEVRRVMIDFSGENRPRTVMLRINNGAQELVAKSGDLHAVARQEATPQIAPGTRLEETLSFLAILGYTEAHLSIRNMHKMQQDGLEWSVRNIVPQEPSKLAAPVTLFELEALDVEEDQVDRATRRLDDVFDRLGLEQVSGSAWQQWVDTVHAQADGSFTYSPEAAVGLAANLAAQGLLNAAS